MLQVVDALYWVLPELNAEAGRREPSPKIEGMLAYADGVNWNPVPTIGRGVFKLISGSWVLWSPVASDITDTAKAALPGAVVHYEVIGTAKQTHTITGLDGDTHGGYDIEMQILNAGSSTAGYKLFANNDQVDANYSSWGGSLYGNYIVQGNYNTADLLSYGSPASTGVSWIEGSIMLGPSSARYFMAMLLHQVGNVTPFQRNVITDSTISNLTRLDIVGSISDAIGPGSYFLLRRKR